MKKLLCIAVASVMAATACASLAACGQVYEQIPVDMDVDLSQPITLHALFPESGMKNFGDSAKDDTAAIIERETGYKVDVYEQKSSSVEGEIENIINNPTASTSQYDFMKLNDGCYTPYLERGSFLDLTDLLENTPEGKVLYQLVDMMDNGWESVKYTDAKGDRHIYAIPDFGYVHMTDSALVWNMAHLKMIGFEDEYHHELPETLSEVTWALTHLQDKFGASNSSYHALAIPGAASANVNPIAGCFEVPYNFFVNDEGKIAYMNESQNMYDYVDYMHMLYSKGILSTSWNTQSAGQVQQNFADKLYSVAYLTYWNVTDLVTSIQSKGSVVAEYNQAFGLTGDNAIKNNVYDVHDYAIKWTNRIRGDGYSFENTKGETVTCKDQKTSKLIGNDGGVSYYTVIPKFMAKNARYVIDYLAKKMEAFANYFGGDGLLLEDQGQYDNDPDKFPTRTHWYEIETPEGAPDPKDYQEIEEIDAQYTAHENFKEGIAFLRPMKYSYKDTRLKANGGHSENGQEVTVTVDEPGRWVKITDRYKKFIANNSQYCTGTQAIAARVYCHLHELGFNAWYYCNYFTDEESWIPNPLGMAPTFRGWGPVNIQARSHYLTGLESAISANDPHGMLDKFNQEARSGVQVGTNTVVFWSDAISAELTAWYNSHKPQN